MKFFLTMETESQTTKLLELRDSSFKMCDILEGLLNNWSNFSAEERSAIGKVLGKADDTAETAMLLYFRDMETSLNRLGVSLFDEEKAIRDFEYVSEDIKKAITDVKRKF